VDFGTGKEAAWALSDEGTDDMVVQPQRVNILGVGVSAVNIPHALAAIEDWIARREQHYVCVTGVHGVMESQRDECLRRIHNASGLTTPDGMPLVWVGRLKGFSQISRVYGPDLMLALCEMASRKGYTNFLYGGAEGIPEQLADNLSGRFPGLKIVGTYSPPFRALTAEEDRTIVERINAADPDIVWVGLSTPKQERWMAEHAGRIHAPVMVGVGAAFNFHTGTVKQAPRWMQRAGLEWAFRIYQEPKRLWKRYFVNNPLFVYHLLRQGMGLEKFP